MRAEQQVSRPEAPPDPPEGQGPTLAWHHPPHRQRIWAGVALSGLCFVVLMVMFRDFSWMSTWWLWAIIGSGPVLTAARSPTRIAAGQDWFRSGRKWVRTHELTEVKVKNDGYGAASLLLLRDAGGRKVSADLLEVRENREVSRLLREGAQYSVRHGGAQANRLAHKNLLFS